MENPNFKLDSIPNLKLRKIKYKNFKAFEDHEWDFTNKRFVSFIGTNGTGKSTTLESIQLLFTNFRAREKEDKGSLVTEVAKKSHVEQILSKCIRKDEEGNVADDFSLIGEFECDGQIYEVEINKKGFVKEHIPKIQEIVYRMCYTTTFDKELHKFSLVKSKWEDFRFLFKAVTGFEIEEEENKAKFSVGSHGDLSESYVMGFYVIKPHEKIHYSECSAGERKVIKTLSKLLSFEIEPKIILIDNIEMHIELGRHIPLINALKETFHNSQIISTTHSYILSRSFGEEDEIYDLRLIHANEVVKREPWRLKIYDEIKDSISKISSISSLSENYKEQLLIEANFLKGWLLEGENEREQIIERMEKFFAEVSVKYLQSSIVC